MLHQNLLELTISAWLKDITIYKNSITNTELVEKNKKGISFTTAIKYNTGKNLMKRVKVLYHEKYVIIIKEIIEDTKMESVHGTEEFVLLK
jgi:hypothetical protein